MKVLDKKKKNQLLESTLFKIYHNQVTLAKQNISNLAIFTNTELQYDADVAESCIHYHLTIVSVC